MWILNTKHLNKSHHAHVYNAKIRGLFFSSFLFFLRQCNTDKKVRQRCFCYRKKKGAITYLRIWFFLVDQSIFLIQDWKDPLTAKKKKSQVFTRRRRNLLRRQKLNKAEFPENAIRGKSDKNVHQRRSSYFREFRWRSKMAY